MGFLPSSMVRAQWIKALKELPRLMGSPQVVTVASSTSLSLSVPQASLPQPVGESMAKT